MTDMQVTFGAIMLALVDGVPKVLTLKEILQQYIDFQRDVISRRTRFDLNKAQDRAHILEGLAKAIDIVDEVIATIRPARADKLRQSRLLWTSLALMTRRQAQSLLIVWVNLAGLEN